MKIHVYTDKFYCTALILLPWHNRILAADSMTGNEDAFKGPWRPLGDAIASNMAIRTVIEQNASQGPISRFITKALFLSKNAEFATFGDETASIFDATTEIARRGM
jgi:hypothetical protein